jgi:hypothetical protein
VGNSKDRLWNVRLVYQETVVKGSRHGRPVHREMVVKKIKRTTERSQMHHQQHRYKFKTQQSIYLVQRALTPMQFAGKRQFSFTELSYQLNGNASY